MRKQRSWYLKLCVIILFGLIPAGIHDRYIMQLLTTCMINIVLYLGLNLLIGLSGQVSLGHSAFFGIGAYTAGLLCTKMGVPFIIALPAGVAASVLAGSLLGLPAARLKGPYLTMTTLGLTQLFTLLAVNLVDITNGPVGVAGIGPLSIFGLEIRAVYPLYLTMFLFMLFSVLVFVRIKNGPLGRAWRAIKDSSIAAEAMGLSITKYNILAFSICSGFAGMAGVLWAYFITYISPDQFSLSLSFAIVSILVIGGRGTVLGTVIAAFIQTFVPEYLRAIGDWKNIVFAIMLIVVVLFAPDGCVGLIEKLKMALTARTSKEGRDGV